MKNSSLRWHVLGWAAYLAYEIVGTYITAQNTVWLELTLSTSMMLLYMVEFYLCYLVVFPHLLRPGRYLALTAALLGVACLFIGLRYGMEEVLFRAVFGFGNYSLSTPFNRYVFENLYYASPAIAASVAAWSARTALRRERENHQLRTEKRAAEVAFLKTQINPHFLYNTLNMLFSMAYPVAKPVANAILKLSELMRYMLHDTPDGQVDLTEEIDYLRNYLDLYRLRFPDSFHVDFRVSGDPAGRRVAPLVLIPFVENAIKHGVLDDPENPVHIRLSIDGEQVRFEVENQRGDGHKDVTTGIGLPNLRRRLELLYPKRHALHVGAAAGQFSTSLRLTSPPAPLLGERGAERVL